MEQNCLATKNDLRQHIDPSKISICKLQNISKGGIVVEFDNTDSSTNLARSVSDKLGADYNVLVPSKRNPKVSVYGLSNECSQQDIVTALKIQNSHIFPSNSMIIVVYIFQLSKTFGVKLEIDPASFKKFFDMSNSLNLLLVGKCVR